MKLIELELTQRDQYNKMQEQWFSIGGTKSTFSIFNSADEDDDPSEKSWIVNYPNILDKTPIIEGKWFIRVDDWERYRSPRKITNPTWKDIARICQQNDGHHVFLEGFDIDENEQTILLVMGS